MEKQKHIREKTYFYLESNGIYHKPTLPFIEKSPSIKNIKQICGRCIILVEKKILSIYPEELKKSHNWLINNSFDKYLSIKEKNIFENDKLTQKDIIRFSWSHESFYILMWALKFCQNVEFPNKENSKTDELLINIPPECSFDEFVQNSNLVNEEILNEQLDIYYHLHWFVRKNARTDIALNKSVIIERRLALEWLWNRNSNWDAVSLDT